MLDSVDTRKVKKGFGTVLVDANHEEHTVKAVLPLNCVPSIDRTAAFKDITSELVLAGCILNSIRSERIWIRRLVSLATNSSVSRNTYPNATVVCDFTIVD